MNVYDIRELTRSEVKESLPFIWESFKKHIAPYCTSEGVDEFKRNIIEDSSFIRAHANKRIVGIGAFDNANLAGVVYFVIKKNMNINNGTPVMAPIGLHILQFFVFETYRKQGIGRLLFNYLCTSSTKDSPYMKDITLNSSHEAVGFYSHLGFKPLGDEHWDNGMLGTPMCFEFE